MALKVASRSLFEASSVDKTQYLSAKNAAALDKDLMSVGAFSIDQLMELAGLSVSQAGRSHVIQLNAQTGSEACSLSSPSSQSRTPSVGCLWTRK